MWKFEILQSLPLYGPSPKRFSATGLGIHSEGFVVRFFASTGENWVGNFLPGLSSCFRVLEHPNRNWLIVISGGQAYVLDPEAQMVIYEFGAQIQDIIEVPELKAIVLGNGLSFVGIGTQGEMWTTRRISWNGMRSLRVKATTLNGEAYDPMTDMWHAFAVDLLSGEVEGGSYNGP